MNIRIIGNSDYCNEIENKFISNPSATQLVDSISFTKDDGSTLSLPNVDTIVIDGSNTPLCQSIRTANSSTIMCVVFLQTDDSWMTKEWKSIEAERFFYKNYPDEYLVYKIIECYNQSQTN